MAIADSKNNVQVILLLLLQGGIDEKVSIVNILSKLSLPSKIKSRVQYRNYTTNMDAEMKHLKIYINVCTNTAVSFNKGTP